MAAILLLCLSLIDAPRIQVIDLDGDRPRSVVVIINGEPYRSVTIPGGGVTPIPIPGPGPTPDPGPVPPPVPDETTVVTGTLWVTYIIGDSPSVADSKPISDPALRARIDGKTVIWRQQNASDPEIERRRFTSVIKAGLPVTVFQDDKGKIIKSVQTNDPAAILATIKQLKGQP